MLFIFCGFIISLACKYFWLLIPCGLFIFVCSQLTLAMCIIARFLQSCRHESWNSVAKYLTEDVPHLLKLEDVKDVQEVLSVVFKCPPADLREFIKWIAEIRRPEDDGNLILSDEEKERLAVKVCYCLFFLFFAFLFCCTYLFLLDFCQCTPQ